MTRIGSKCGKTKQRQQGCSEEWRSIIALLEANNPYAASQKFVKHIQNSYEAFVRFNHDPEELTEPSSKETE